jgi:hypothetical protein
MLPPLSFHRTRRFAFRTYVGMSRTPWRRGAGLASSSAHSRPRCKAWSGPGSPAAAADSIRQALAERREAARVRHPLAHAYAPLRDAPRAWGTSLSAAALLRHRGMDRAAVRPLASEPNAQHRRAQQVRASQRQARDTFADVSAASIATIRSQSISRPPDTSECPASTCRLAFRIPGVQGRCAIVGCNGAAGVSKTSHVLPGAAAMLA